MHFLRNLLGILAVVGGLAVTVWIGRYSSFGKSAPQLQAANGAIQKTPTEPAKKEDKAAVPEHRKHPSADTPAAAPEVVSPESLLSNGLRTAKRESKRVLLEILWDSNEQSNTLADFLDENFGQLQSDFVLVRIEYKNTIIAYQQLPVVEEFMKRLRNANSRSLPWIAILDAEGRVLSDLDSPSGNVGYPRTPEEIAYFAAMLRKATTPASAARIAKIEQQLRADQERWKDAEGRGRLPIEKTVTPRDAAVLSATFKHFVEHEKWLCEHPREKTLLVVDAETKGKYPFDRGRPRENYLNLASRNTEKGSLRGLSFGKEVIVEDTKRFGPRHFDFQVYAQEKYPLVERFCYVYLRLPGYSNDRRTAVVRFMFGPSAHGAAATYLLKNENGTWIVTEYDLAYFL